MLVVDLHGGETAQQEPRRLELVHGVRIERRERSGEIPVGLGGGVAVRDGEKFFAADSHGRSSDGADRLSYFPASRATTGAKASIRSLGTMV